MLDCLVWRSYDLFLLSGYQHPDTFLPGARLATFLSQIMMQSHFLKPSSWACMFGPGCIFLQSVALHPTPSPSKHPVSFLAQLQLPTGSGPVLGLVTGWVMLGVRGQLLLGSSLLTWVGRLAVITQWSEFPELMGKIKHMNKTCPLWFYATRARACLEDLNPSLTPS